MKGIYLGSRLSLSQVLLKTIKHSSLNIFYVNFSSLPDIFVVSGPEYWTFLINDITNPIRYFIQPNLKTFPTGSLETKRRKSPSGHYKIKKNNNKTIKQKLYCQLKLHNL